jgi:hypothetical protein
MTLFTFILLSYGVTNIAVFGSIFNGWRVFWSKKSPKFFGKLFTCPMCLSMWVGMVLSFMFINYGWVTPMSSYGLDITYITIFLDGCLVSGGVWILHTIQEFFERAFVSEE